MRVINNSLPAKERIDPVTATSTIFIKISEKFCLQNEQQIIYIIKCVERKHLKKVSQYSTLQRESAVHCLEFGNSLR